MRARHVAALAGAMLLGIGILLWLFAASVDHKVAAGLHLHVHSPGLSSVRLLTRIGGGAAMIPLVLAVCVWLAVRRATGRALWLLVTVASGRILVAVLKALIGRARPDIEGQLVHVGSASFPSAHSAGTMLTVAALLLVLRPRRGWWAVALLWPLLIGVTRIMLGVHWPSDVLGGWGFALLWTGLCARWLPAWPHTGRAESDERPPPPSAEAGRSRP